MGEKCPDNLADGLRLPRFFNVQQICDMGQTALLPFRRKACLGFFPPEKIRRLRQGLNPRSWGPGASTLTTRLPKPLSCTDIVHIITDSVITWSLNNRLCDHIVTK